MKKIFKRYLIVLTSLITFISILFGMNSTVLAETLSVINTTITRMATIPNVKVGGVNCTNIGGLSVASNDSNKRLYVVKSNENEVESVLYFYANYDNISDKMDNSNNSNYGICKIRGLIGHANAMTLDDNYIYITCWKKEKSNDKEEVKNQILRISRNEIWSMYKNRNGNNMGTIDSDNMHNSVIFTAERLNNAGKYVEYNRGIKSITKYKNNGEFIIGRTQDDNILTFTTAKIENNRFIVSRDSKDIFTVEIDEDAGIGQDIGYSPSNGFFIPRWNSEAENTIYWVKLNSLSGENRVYKNDGNSKFRKISVKKVNNTIKKWEVESISFDNDNDMIVSANVEDNKDPHVYKDGIFKIRRKTATSGGSYKFLGSNIDK